jgi:hypothetical protein
MRSSLATDERPARLTAAAMAISARHARPWLREIDGEQTRSHD